MNKRFAKDLGKQTDFFFHLIGRSLILPWLPYRNGCLRNLESGGTGNTFEHKVFFHIINLVSINNQYRNKYNKRDLAQHIQY